MDCTFLAGLFYEIEDAAIFGGHQAHHRVGCGTSHRKHCHHTPLLHSFFYKKLLYVAKVAIVASVHACQHIELHLRMRHKHINGTVHHSKTVGIAAHPIVVVADSVQADGH